MSSQQERFKLYTKVVRQMELIECQIPPCIRYLGLASIAAIAFLLAQASQDLSNTNSVSRASNNARAMIDR